MAFTQLTTDLNIIAALDNEPNDASGLTPTELKAKFDAAANIIKTYINGTLIAETEGSTGAANVGFAKPATMNATTVQGAIEEIESVLQDSQKTYVNPISEATITSVWGA